MIPRLCLSASAAHTLGDWHSAGNYVEYQKMITSSENTIALVPFPTHAAAIEYFIPRIRLWPAKRKVENKWCWISVFPIGINNSICVSCVDSGRSYSKTQIHRMSVSQQMITIKMSLSSFYLLLGPSDIPWACRNAYHPKKECHLTLCTRESVMRPAMKGCLWPFFCCCCCCWYSTNLSRFFDGHAEINATSIKPSVVHIDDH